MRIALIASSLRLAGAEKQFSYAARTLVDAGIDTHVFYLGGGDYFQTVLTEAGIPLHQIFNRQPLLMLARLIKELAALRPDMVLASQFGDLIFAGPAGRLCGALVFGGVRSDGFYELRTAGRRSWLMVKLAHGLIANSQRARDNLVLRGIEAQKIAVVPNVIDLVNFDDKVAKPFENVALANRIPIVAIGSLHSCKRFDRFLDGLAIARQCEPAILGIIAGQDLGEKAALERKANALGLLPGHVEFLGECEYIPSLLGRCRMLVSCSEFEGFPNVILEAMAARLPVLATPAGDAGRIVKDGVTGYLLEPDNARNMAERIVSLIRDPALSRQMGEAARKQVEQDYNITSLAPRLLSVFSNFTRREGKSIMTQSQVERAPSRIQGVAGSVSFHRLAGTIAPPIRPETEGLGESP